MRNKRKSNNKKLINFIKIKSFCSSKDTNKKGQSQPTNWEKTTQLIRDLTLEAVKYSYDSTIKRKITQLKTAPRI